MKTKQKWFITRKPDEKIYALYDFARSAEQAKNIINDLQDALPIVHKSTSQGGLYNIYVKRGNLLVNGKLVCFAY